MLTIKPTSGLCNYLRVVFSYYQYAKSINEELTVIWIVTEACNGYFLDFFKPIKSIHFISKEEPNAELYYQGHSIHPDFPPNYSELRLLPYMIDIINDKVNQLDRNYIAVHVRRTDHIRLAVTKNKFTTDDEFFKYIDNADNEKNIYIATDNKKTYDTFKQKYQNRIKFEYHETDDNALRHTTLQCAIIDLFICVFASDFMGSSWSSFSGLINNLRKSGLSNNELTK